MKDDNLIPDLVKVLKDSMSIKYPIKDMEEEVKKLKGKIIRDEKTVKPEIKGTEKGTFVIILPKDIKKEEERYFVARELGYLFLHMGYLINPVLFKDYNNKTFSDNMLETKLEAKEFALEFLMPTEEYIKYVRETFDKNIVDIVKIANHFVVPVSLALEKGEIINAM